MGTPACLQVCWTTLFTAGVTAVSFGADTLRTMRLTGLVSLRAGFGHAGLDLRHELGFGAVAGEVGERGTAVGRQGCSEALQLENEVS